MNKNDRGIIVLGYGNSGCQDDGLGPRFACALRALDIEGVTAEVKSQLTIEDARAISLSDAVIFVDATLDGPEPYLFENMRPDSTLGFRTHYLEPAALLALAHSLFGVRTAGYVLGIRGYAFQSFAEGLSKKARRNLEAALEFIVSLLQSTPLRKVESCLKNKT